MRVLLGRGFCLFGHLCGIRPGHHDLSERAGQRYGFRRFGRNLHGRQHFYRHSRTGKNEAEEAAKAINEATAAAAAAGYTWNRTSEFTKDIDVGGSTATNAINTVIQAVDSNANINSVVGGFIGIGTKDATIAKGADAATEIGYHGDSYKLKATTLEAADLQGLTKNGDTYTFTLANADTPKKDGATALNRLTDDIVTQEEVSAEIQEQVGSSITVSSLVGTYSNIKVEVTITDGKLQKLTYSYDAEVTELGLKVAILTVKGTGAMHTEATYSDFVY